MTRLDDLTRLREQLIGWMDEAPADRKAALVAQYRATLAEIDELAPPAKEVDSVDEIAQRRTARRAGSTKPARRAKQSG